MYIGCLADSFGAAFALLFNDNLKLKNKRYKWSILKHMNT